MLVEISEIRLSDRERHVLDDKYRTPWARCSPPTPSTSARSWPPPITVGGPHGAQLVGLPHAASVPGRSDVFHVDQKRLMAFTEKSGQFLDTFWKLARDRKIPDRWLIRNQDLHNLEKAMQEHDLSIRLRVLKRMQDFMVCFPPYWYYVARTQQALGRLAWARRKGTSGS